MKFTDKLALLKNGVSMADIKELEAQEELEKKDPPEEPSKKPDDEPAGKEDNPNPEPEKPEEKKEAEKEEPNYKELYEQAQKELKAAQASNNRKDASGGEKEVSVSEILTSFY